jgi:aspartokinase
LPHLTFEEALTLADHGCDLLQRQAIQLAAQCNLPLVVRSLDESAPLSCLSCVTAKQAEPLLRSPSSRRKRWLPLKGVTMAKDTFSGSISNPENSKRFRNRKEQQNEICNQDDSRLATL